LGLARRGAVAAAATQESTFTSTAMLWVKAFHIVFVASWFAALFYLPRIFVNLAQVRADSHAERERLLVMARRLFRFGMILMTVALALGLTLWLAFGIGRGQGWLHAKLVLVVGVLVYQHLCLVLLRRFEARLATPSEGRLRLFNEVSVLLFAGVVVLTVVKPW
jgi:protoporphyrinogen IX oxidase